MYTTIPRLESFDFSNKRVLMRADFNVPIDKKTGKITSEKRIISALPTIQYILSKNPSQLVLMSHLGKPKKLAEKGEDFTKKLSLSIVAQKLSELLGMEIPLCAQYIDSKLPSSKVVLLENVRFNYKEEQSKDDATRLNFAKKLASHGDIFINDAFGTCHRKEASVYDVATLLPSGIGQLVEKEITHLGMLIDKPRHPFVAILGGAKVEDKVQVIEALAPQVDAIIIIGAMEFAFRSALNQHIGSSLCEGVDVAKKVLASSYASKLYLPFDTVIAKKEGDNFVDIKTVPAGNIPDGYMGLDCGPKTITMILDHCKNAEMVFWNGPAGLIEIKPFDVGTVEIARQLSLLSNTRVVGGGDSVGVIEQLGLESSFTHVSTGGGASLEFLQDGKLVALDILNK